MTQCGLLVDEWTGAYRDSWKGLIVPEAFAHPSRFAKGLIFKIIAHAFQEGFINQGSTVFDCFAGVATGALPCLLHGVNWLGIELEARFVALGQHNLAYWQQRYGHRLQGAQARLLRGDSRQLLAGLGTFDMVLTSPPYADGCTHTGGPDPHAEHIQGGPPRYVRYGQAVGVGPAFV